MVNPISNELHKYAKALDLMLLNPAMSLDETLKGCQSAHIHHLASVFVKPCFVREAVEAHRIDGIHVGTVIGYPHGAHSTHTKMSEVKRALIQGASEFEMVLNTGYIRSGLVECIKKEIQSVSGVVHMNGGVLKVTLEAGYLTQNQMISTSRIAVISKADGIVISTGYGPEINHLEYITILSEFLREGVPLKAMGGIKSVNDIATLTEAGYARVGINDLPQIIS